MSEIISIKNLKKSYENGNIKALNGINLSIDRGDFVSIMGPSGSGKSTLLNMIGSLDKPDGGNINIAGHNLLKEKDLSDFRAKKIGFIFQLHNLIPTISAQENVEIPLYNQRVKSKDMKKKSIKLLEYMGLESRAKDNPTKLSGGERQRVSIARALINKPEIILADEPTGSLDSETGDKVLDILKRLHKEHNVTLIIVTHDQRVAEMAEKIIKVKDGHIEI